MEDRKTLPQGLENIVKLFDGWRSEVMNSITSEEIRT